MTFAPTSFSFYLSIYWLHWVFTVVHGLSLVVMQFLYSLVAVSGGYFSLQCTDRLLVVMPCLCCRAPALGTRAQLVWLTGSRAQAQQLWCTGLVAPRHVGSFGTRARTRIPCMAGRFLTTVSPGKSPNQLFNVISSSFQCHFIFHCTLKLNQAICCCM